MERSGAARGDPDVAAPVPVSAVQRCSLPTASLLRRQQDQSRGLCVCMCVCVYACVSVAFLLEQCHMQHPKQPSISFSLGNPHSINLAGNTGEGLIVSVKSDNSWYCILIENGSTLPKWP